MTIPEHMTAVLLTGHGGLDRLEMRHDVPVPKPRPGEVLIHVAAAAISNTDINTHTAWYSKAVTDATSAGGAAGLAAADDADGSWSGTPLTFPRIQGADCCGRIVAVGEGRLRERVLVRNMLQSHVDFRPYECWTLGSECDGAFAQFTKAPARETCKVDCDWSDAELASIPCAWSAAENMLHRANVGAERVLITGASSGVGLAALQLAKRRGGDVTAVAGAAKAARLLDLGANRVVDRNADLMKDIGEGSIDVVIDLVAGAGWPAFLDILVRGGRYATAGAIAGPMVTLDARTLYLKDLTFFGCTFQDEIVFQNLIGYIERGEIEPVVERTYPLSEIAKAQDDFLTKQHVGKLVLIPPEVQEQP